MNYKTHYDNLINRAKERTLDCYTESHHIIPRCLGGSDDKDNLVNLTAREHFIAHLLLWKIHPKSYSLIKAINMMCIQSTNMNENRSCNRMYGWLKEHHSKAMSLSQSGDGNSQFGTMWIHNLDLKESKKIPKSDEIPLGWNKGRKIKFDEKVLKEKIDFSINGRDKALSFLFSFCVSESNSIVEYAHNIGVNDNTIHHYFRTYLPERKEIFKTGQKPDKKIIKKFLNEQGLIA